MIMMMMMMMMMTGWIRNLIFKLMKTISENAKVLRAEFDFEIDEHLMSNSYIRIYESD
jgi:hypothetical protein